MKLIKVLFGILFLLLITGCSSVSISESPIINQTGNFTFVNQSVNNYNGAFIQEGSNIYYNLGNVGIGTTNPETNLEVSGSTGSKIRLRDTAGGGNRKIIDLVKDSDSFFINSVRDDGTTQKQISFDVDLNAVFPGSLSITSLTLSSDFTLGTNKIQRNTNNFLQWTSVGNVATWQGQDGFSIRDETKTYITIQDSTGKVVISNLTGVGNAYVCVDSTGKLYRNTTCE